MKGGLYGYFADHYTSIMRARDAGLSSLQGFGVSSQRRILDLSDLQSGDYTPSALARSPRGVRVTRVSVMKSQQLGVSVAIAVLLAAVFFIDIRTGLGFTPWLLYVVPLGLTYWIGSSYSPIIVAVGCIALMFLGYALSPPLVSPPIALTNRLFGTVTFLAMGGLIMAYKLLARRLSLLTDQLRQELFERTQDLGRAVRILKTEMAIKSREVSPLAEEDLGRHLTNVLVVESRRLQEQFGHLEEREVLSAEHRLEETRNELDRLTKQLEQFQRDLLSRESR